jgi:hypothetical protein
MKIEQLRIGNYYNYFEDTCKGIMIGIKHSSFSNDTKICMSVESDSVNGTNTTVSSGWIQTDLEGLTPTPLTEEWLIKFGGTFKIYGYGDNEWKSWNIDGESFKQNGTGITFTSGDIDINSVHELQDLFYVLKKELTIKQK